MWDFAWTDSALFIDRRITEELLKRRFGEPKVVFTIPINWIDEFDIFSNLRLQDLFGIDDSSLPPEERGEYGRYYYVESITYDPLGDKMTIKAVDLQFIIRQCIILGDCDAIADKWEDATESDRMYGYLCHCGSGDGGEFVSDGELCKILCPCL